MDQSQSTGEIVVGQVGEILAELQTGEHALVDDIAAGERTDIEILI